MTALCSGSNRAGRGTPSPETAKVAEAFRDLAARTGHAPTEAELLAELARRLWRIEPERVRVHLSLARLRVRAGEGAAS